MKKFLTYMPMQSPRAILYQSDNELLRMDTPVHFPVVAMVNGYAQIGDEISVLVMLEKDNDVCRANMEKLNAELKEIAVKKGIFYRIEEILVSRDESVTAQLATFSRLIEQVEDNDSLYACITFGTKPTPIIEMMALNFAYKTKKNMSIPCIAYGKVNWESIDIPGDCYIYDVTALFYMNEISNLLASEGVQNPAESIYRILQTGQR